MSQIIPIYIPTYISDQNYNPARVLPRVMFYNGQVDCEPFYVKDGNNSARRVDQFPYFDNYNVVSGSFPTTDSDSLLFYNESAAYGEVPTDSLYTKYWQNYVELLYNPRTRLLNASAIIPLADYFKMELNDIVEFRGNTYHLRAINDYNLSNGECKIQLLGPILEGALNINSPVAANCGFTFSSSIVPVTTTTTSTTSTSTSTTTLPPGLCSTYRITNTSTSGASTSITYTPCGTSVSQIFYIPVNTTYEICVYNNQIDTRRPVFNTAQPNIVATNLGTTCTQTPTTCAQYSVFNPTGNQQTFSFISCADAQCNGNFLVAINPGETRVVCAKPQSLLAGNNIATVIGSCSSSCFLPINIGPTTTTSTTTTSTTTSTTTLPPTTTTTTTINCNFDFTANNSTPITATGGRVGRFVSGGIEYQYHDFESAGSFTLAVQSGFTNQAQILVVAGGGAGGDLAGGGGGGLIYRNNITLVQNNYSVVVGAGGSYWGRPTLSEPPGYIDNTNGGNSQFTPSYVAIGGGKGGWESRLATPSTWNGGNGGSGGGAIQAGSRSGTAGTGTTNQGFAGGGVTQFNVGGGGGSYATTGSINTSIGGKGTFFELGALVKGRVPGDSEYVKVTDFSGGGGRVAIDWQGGTSPSITSGGGQGRTGAPNAGRNGQGGGGSAGERTIAGQPGEYGVPGGSGRVIVVYPYVEPYTPITASYLAVAGGGQGGYINSTIYTLGNVSDVCGGGAGGFLSGSITFETSASYQITVGTGGNTSGDRFAGASGGNSTIGSNIVAFGGGGGSAVYDVSPPFNSVNRGSNGGSGGGATGLAGDSTALTGVAGQGFAGGVGLVQNSDAAGGGGAGSVGNAGQGNNGGTGRTSSISGTLTTYSKGGNGRTSNPGVVNTELGSGGRGEWAGASTNTRGLNGIVIIRYPGSAKATGGTITQVGGDTVHTFTSSGTFTPIQGI